MGTIGERIRELRGKLSREAFAAKYAIHRNTVERYEKNLRTPDTLFLQELARQENVNLEWVKLGVGPKYKKDLQHSQVQQPPVLTQHFENIDTGSLVTCDSRNFLEIQHQNSVLQDRHLMKKLGQRIKMIRQGISRAVFSKRLGISPVTLKRYEDGLREADPGFLERLISDQKLCRDWLLNGTGPMYRDERSCDANDISNNNTELLVAMHDLGKVSPKFQARLKNFLPEWKVSDGRTNEEEISTQHIENTSIEKNKNVRHVGQTGEMVILDRYLRAVDESNTLIRENADLRIQLERKDSRIRDLEREAAEVPALKARIAELERELSERPKQPKVIQVDVSAKSKPTPGHGTGADKTVVPGAGAGVSGVGNLGAVVREGGK